MRVRSQDSPVTAPVTSPGRSLSTSPARSPVTAGSRWNDWPKTTPPGVTSPSGVVRGRSKPSGGRQEPAMGHRDSISAISFSGCARCGLGGRAGWVFIVLRAARGSLGARRTSPQWCCARRVRRGRSCAEQRDGRPLLRCGLINNSVIIMISAHQQAYRSHHSRHCHKFPRKHRHKLRMWGAYRASGGGRRADSMHPGHAAIRA